MRRYELFRGDCRLSIEDSGAPEPIHSLPSSVLGETVAFASTEQTHGLRSKLVLSLLRALEPFAIPWYDLPDEHAFTLQRGHLGAPILLLGNEQGPYLSFSHGGGRLWAAMSRKGVGIDVAYPEEFSGSYPFTRVFRPQEMDFAGVLCQGATAKGAALLWSVKEASVKATGGGFNIFDPLEVQVGTPVLGGQGIFFKVIAPITQFPPGQGQRARVGSLWHALSSDQFGA